MVTDIVRQKGFLTLGSRLRRIGERLQAETQQVMAIHDVPIQASQYPVLAAIDENGDLSIGDLAEALGISQPGVTRSIGQLADQGVVEVRRSPTDQRTRLVSLTERGQQIVNHGREIVWPQIEDCVAEMVAAEPESLLAHLDRLEASLQDASFVQRMSARSRNNGT